MMWTALTAVSLAVTGALVVGVVYLITRIIAFLQPLLIPFAMAGVLAYLLEPVVARLVRWGLSRQRAVWGVFISATAVLVGIMFIIVPAMLNQGVEFYHVVPQSAKKAGMKISVWSVNLNERLHKDYGIDLLRLHEAKTDKPGETKPETNGTPAPAVNGGVPSPAPGSEKTSATPAAENSTVQNLISGEWLQRELPVFMATAWTFITSSLGGFLGVFGFLLSLIIVPLYLYYFLMETQKISESWSNYVPLRASQFKDEVVSTLEEINRYLIAFFRGQLVVSIINGIATAIGLTALGLKFGWLIGLSLCVLGIVPYVGIAVCLIPALIIASVQNGSWLIDADAAWWVFPVSVAGVFTVVQQVDSFFITPRVVGESVGLHPMTVIVSLFAWSLILGGLLGAILAVPMTAAVKVLFQRYIWKRTVEPRLQQDWRPGTET